METLQKEIHPNINQEENENRLVRAERAKQREREGESEGNKKTER